ncbi:MAG: metalloregulator ArsR/SmtB family transcription factor [Lachnospiraceae bacterium]|nr:metalloregulator ArsR/SmtB family transcription factor [Lachnospiraceae bacterium]
MERDPKWYEQAFKALGDSSRLQILGLLEERSMNAAELLEQVSVVQSTLSHHMKTLCEAGVVTGTRSGKNVLYSLNREALAELAGFLTGHVPLEKKSKKNKGKGKEKDKLRDEEKERIGNKSEKNKKEFEKNKKKMKDKSKTGKKHKTNGKIRV